MTEPILDPSYWKRRLQDAPTLHQSIFRCPMDKWQRIEEKHRQILRRHIRYQDTILDAGCGYGRLLTLLPDYWVGFQRNLETRQPLYCGVDLSPDFVELARETYPDYRFEVGDLRKFNPFSGETTYTRYEWAVLISIRPMVIRNLGETEWLRMESNLRKYATKLLFLEYDEFDEGSVE